MTTIAVMQPYLWPYAGYYRLLAAADVFVVYDCVQFIRRGRIHRNEFDAGGHTQWLTLPLAKPAYHDRIDVVRFSDDAPAQFVRRLQPFRRLRRALHALAQADPHRSQPRAGASLADFLIEQLQLTARVLGIACRFERSSRLALPAQLRGEDRILSICAALNAKRYVNVDGGRALYDARRFARHGIELRFLTPYCGPMDSVQERLGDAADIAVAARAVRAEIDRNTQLQ